MTVGSILGGTWAFIRANPAAIAVWGLVYLGINIALRLALAPIMAAQMAAAAARAQGVPAPFPPIGGFFLVWLLLMGGIGVLAAAVWRGVLFPERNQAFYLRLGGDEGRLIGLLLVAFVAAIVIEIVLVIAIVVLALVFGITASTQVTSGTVLFFFLLFVALFVAAIWLQVRLSLIGPMTVARGRWAVREGWQLTRGRFWTLLGAYLVIWLILIGVSLLLAIPTLGVMAAAFRNVGDPQAQATLAQAQAAQMGFTTPAALVVLLLGAVLGTVLFVALAAAPAVAARQILDGRAGLR